MDRNMKANEKRIKRKEGELFGIQMEINI